MLSLKWREDLPNSSHPQRNYTKLNTLHRITGYNLKSYREYIERSATNLEDQHPLVGFVRHFAISPEWEASECIEYVRYFSLGLTSLFGLTSISSRGEVITNGAILGTSQERWVSYDSGIDYTKVTDWRRIKSIIPLYHEGDTRTYKNLTERGLGTNSGLGVVAIDVIGLLYGWWLYMRDSSKSNKGIHKYLLEGPLFNSTLLSNELCIFNSLHDHLVNGVSLRDTVSFAGSTFATLDENKLILDYLNHLVKIYQGRRPNNIHDFFSQQRSIYRNFNSELIDTNRNGIISQHSWVNEISYMRRLQVYLSVCTLHDKKANDVNTNITISSRMLRTNFRRITDPTFRKLYNDNLDLLLSLNDSNYR